jgi:hypothetical protein
MGDRCRTMPTYPQFSPESLASPVRATLVDCKELFDAKLGPVLRKLQLVALHEEWRRRDK